MDEDGAVSTPLINIAAGATNVGALPSIGASATTTGNTANSLGLIIGPGQAFYIAGNAAALNETLTISIVLLLSTNVEPTWATTGSAGTPSLAANTISAANTMQAVIMP